jgi:hypothetical protein
MDVVKKIKDLILRGRFLKAKKEVAFLSNDELENVLDKIAFDERSISAYTFLAFLIKEHETLKYHALARVLLNIAFCHIEGAYQTALSHAYRSLELTPDDIDLQELLLFFNNIPEKVITDEEAQVIARDVLLKKPTSEHAQRVLQQQLDAKEKQ